MTAASRSRQRSLQTTASACAPTTDLLVVHSSDVHVDDDYTARLHGGDGTRGLRCVLETARALAADLVILAGDTFENNRLPARILDRAARLLQDAGLPVVLLPGNHDPLIAESAFHRARLMELPDVHVLGAAVEEDAVLFPDLQLEVWGRPHRDYEDMRPLGRARPRRSRWQIAVAHGHYEERPNRRTPFRPSWLIGARDLVAASADYLALGHWNRPVRVGPHRAGAGEVHAFYSGAPEYAGTVNAIRLTASGAVTVARQPIQWNGAPPTAI